MEKYGISRTTVRRAIDTLAQEQLVVRKQGKGTFTRSARLVHQLDRLRPFVTILESAGEPPECNLLVYEWLEADASVPGPVQSKLGAVLHVRRLYLVDSIPVAMADIYVPSGIAERISRSAVEKHPVYHVLEQELGLELKFGDVVVQSVSGNADISRCLGVDYGVPLLKLERTTFGANSQLLECSVLHLRAESFELRVRIGAGQGGSFAYQFVESQPRLALREAGGN